VTNPDTALVPQSRHYSVWHHYALYEDSAHSHPGGRLVGCWLRANQAGRCRSSAVDAPTAAADLLIISATYGSGTHYSDVTCRVNDLLRQPEAEFFARPEWLSADPTPGWNKALVIVYEVKGRRHTFATGEGGKVSASLLLNTDK
jgi:hypothetical protein